MKCTRIVSLVAALGAWLVPCAEAQEFTAGSAAPSLDVAHWLKGDDVTAFEPGRVYVLEFWAPWCLFSVTHMETLSRIQETYAERGVSVIGLSAEPLQSSVRFLLANGAAQDRRTRYTLATDPDRSVHEAYLEASGLWSVPAVFVVGKDARVEWFGHPTDLEAVLEAVVTDTWEREKWEPATRAEQEANRALRDMQQQLSAALADAEWELALDALDRLIAAGQETYVPTKLDVLFCRMHAYERGYAYAREVLAASSESNAVLCHQVAKVSSGSAPFVVETAHRNLDLALQAAERAVELEPLAEHVALLASIRTQRGEASEVVAEAEPAQEPDATTAAPAQPVAAQPETRANGGTYAGKVQFEGERPEATPLDIKPESSVGCVAKGAVDATDVTLLIHAGGGIANVVVTVEVDGADAPVPEAPIVLDQRGCRFEPHVMVVPVGCTVEFLNSDTIGHNIHTYPKRSVGVNSTVAPGAKLSKLLGVAETIEVKCDVHPWMNSHLFVSEDPFVAVTAADGSFRIAGLPPGTYDVALWHEQLGKGEAEIVVGEDGTVTGDLAPTLGAKKKGRGRRR